MADLCTYACTMKSARECGNMFYVLFHEIQWLYIINITNKFTYL